MYLPQWLWYSAQISWRQGTKADIKGNRGSDNPKYSGIIVRDKSVGWQNLIFLSTSTSWPGSQLLKWGVRWPSRPVKSLQTLLSSLSFQFKISGKLLKWSISFLSAKLFCYYRDTGRCFDLTMSSDLNKHALRWTETNTYMKRQLQCSVQQNEHACDLVISEPYSYVLCPCDFLTK